MDIRTLCLGLLTLRESSGYEIKKAFESELAPFYEASFGSIYPALGRLTEEGLVSRTEQAQEKRPDKKVYRITSAGRLAFLDALAEPPSRDRTRSDFLAILLFADLLPARHLAGLIDERLAAHQSAARQIKSELAATLPAGRRFVLGHALALYEAAIAYVEENRHLVESEALLAKAGPGSGSGSGSGRLTAP